MKNLAVVISGCGFKDGAEITETVSTLIAISETGAKFEIFAPDISNVLTEADRIARGKIKNLNTLVAENFDAVIFPGGYGASKLLCTFATEGAKCKTLPEVKKIIEDFHKLDKPIGALCIAPAIIASVLGKHGITLTIGNDEETARELEKMGAEHATCAVDDFITDREFKIVTSPAYMYGDATPFQVYTGIRRAVREILEMA